MKCVILVAGHGTVLENEIRIQCPQQLGVPKALLPGIGNKKILDSWWGVVNQRHLFADVYLVTNADKYKVRLLIKIFQIIQ
jgi:glucuronokinase